MKTSTLAAISSHVMTGVLLIFRLTFNGNIELHPSDKTRFVLFYVFWRFSVAHFSEKPLSLTSRDSLDCLCTRRNKGETHEIQNPRYPVQLSADVRRAG